MRAIDPAKTGTIDLAGFRVAYETFGDPANPAILLYPSWQIIHSRMWKMQVPYLARDFHVITFDPPGNGKSERTTDPAAFEIDRSVNYGVGLLDHLGVAQAHVMGISRGGALALWAAARAPERILKAVLIAPSLPPGLLTGNPAFWERRDEYRGAEKRNANYWLQDYEGWLSYFFGEICTEPHSTKVFDDLVSWGRETTPEILIQTVNNPALLPELSLDEVLERVRCPVLLIHGADDRIVPIERSELLARERPDFTYVVLEGSGHAPIGRDPVKVNDLVGEFIGRPSPQKHTWRRAMARRPKQALFVSSPIGLGHIGRDLEIARHLRERIPDLQIDWFASHPVTLALEQAGERVHPLSYELAIKSAHWESMSGEHELHCFYAFREMDEIMLHNFMVFLDAVRETPYDLWIGDEAWEVDHFLHENPELKSAPFVFMTDFVGFIPMDPSPGSREAELTADYNAEMIEHIARFPWVRDRSLFFGSFDEIVPHRFGPGLPPIRDWMEEHFTPVGYPLAFDPESHGDPHELRRRLGYDTERTLVVTSAGGTGTGQHLFQKMVAAWPLVLKELPDARGEIVAGPRVDTAAFHPPDGLDVLPYVDRLHERFAAADLGVIQGGLTSAMELVATRRPFLYFPLKNHFEQVFHVAYRLDRYCAGTRLDYHETTPEDLAAWIVRSIGADTSDYQPVEPGAAARAAEEIASTIRE